MLVASVMHLHLVLVFDLQCAHTPTPVGRINNYFNHRSFSHWLLAVTSSRCIIHASHSPRHNMYDAAFLNYLNFLHIAGDLNAFR